MILLKGALAYGFPNDLWTLKRIAHVIQKEFEVEYHLGHIWKLLRRLGWSCQVPERRAIQRDEKAIEHWKRYKWPAIKKSHKTWCPPRLPRRKRVPSHTNATQDMGPEGQTPIVRYSYRHDRISALATLTVSAQRKHMGMYARFWQENFKAVHVAEFLRLLLRHLRGNVILLWDEAQIHKGPLIEEVQMNYPRLHVEWFPGYAPELNPVEQIWNDFKGHSANSLFLDKQDIRLNLHANARRVRRSQAKLRSFILSSELTSSPW